MQWTVGAREISEDGESVEMRTLETPVGIVTQRMRKDPSYGSDWIQKHYIESVDDYNVMAYVAQNTVFSP